MTPYQLPYGHEARCQLCFFGECVFYVVQHRDKIGKPVIIWSKGIWVGVSDNNGCHIVLDSNGVNLARSVKRMVREAMWTASFSLVLVAFLGPESMVLETLSMPSHILPMTL